MANSIIRACKNCGKDISEKMKGTRFCSKSCGAKHRRNNGGVKCSVDWCDSSSVKKGMCDKHYSQFLTKGFIVRSTKYDKNEVIYHNDYVEILLYNKDHEVICSTYVDNDDYALISNCRFGMGADGYVLLSINGRRIPLHRFIMKADSGSIVDHENRNKIDNRKNNLRLASKSQNAINAKVREDSSTKVKGVTFNKNSDLFRARAVVNGKQKHLGCFKNIEDAAKARHDAVIKSFGEFVNPDNP